MTQIASLAPTGSDVRNCNHVSRRYESGKALVPAGHGVLGDMAVGVWAQLVAGIVYTPIDIVKERLQVRSNFLEAGVDAPCSGS